MKIKKALFSAAAVFVLGWLFYKQVSTPLPGQKVEDLGRDHVPDGTLVAYNSNPPTSGPHYDEWARAGVYENPVSDGHLVHSLEHGYIILSYNCLVNPQSVSLVPAAFAHEEDLQEAEGAEGIESEVLEEDLWESEECRGLVSLLSGVYEKKGKSKIIVIPRPSLDTRIALTAWGRIDKFWDFDEERITKFIDAFRDKGPEKTME